MKTPNIDLAAIIACRATFPHKLISLWDMIEFLGYDFVRLLSELEWQGFDADQICKTSGPIALATVEDKKRLRELLSGLVKHCERLQLKGSITAIIHFQSRIGEESSSPFQVIESEISHLRFSIHSELQRERFFYIKTETAEFFGRDDLFGPDFYNNATQLMRDELKSAGNCIAVNEPIAAVFYLMRLAEHGLHALAKHLGVNYKGGAVPIEFSEWNDIIGLIDEDLKARRSASQALARGYAKDAELEFYGGLQTDLIFFRDKYRNPVSHLRGIFDSNEARTVFNRVREFMQRLATRVPLK